MRRAYSRSHANRGAKLEKLIDMTNTQYRNKGVALIDKVPNAWVVQRDGKRIVSAFPQRKTGVDYVGVSHGRAIAIEAKSTTNRTSFPLSMIQDHQIKFLQQFVDQGGVSFFIIEFSKLGEIYFAPFEFVSKWLYEEGYRYVVRDKDMPVLSCYSLKPKRYRDLESWGYVNPLSIGVMMAYPIKNNDITEIDYSNRSATLISDFLNEAEGWSHGS